MSLKRISLLSISGLVLCVMMVAYFKLAVLSGYYYGVSDFFKMYQSTLFYYSGQNIYSADNNLNTPFLLLFLLPFHVFNYAQASQVWNVILILSVLLGAYFALRPFPQWHKNTLPLMALFSIYLPNSSTLACGQITPILLVFLVFAWLLARKGNDYSAGVLIGFLCALKLFFGLFLIYFLCLKRVRLVLTALATMIMAFLISVYVFGLQSFVSYHTVLHHITWYASSWNASFYGFFTRLFSNAEGNVPVVVAPYFTTIFTVLCSVVLMVCLIGLWIKWGRQKFDNGFSLVIVSMLLLSPLGWVYYFPLLLIPYVVLVEEGNTWTHLAACFLLLMSTQTSGILVPNQINTMKQIFMWGGLGFYVLLGLLGLLCLVSYGVRRSEKYAISENLWCVIYIVIFVPSLISLGAIFRGIMACH
ncbi:MAG TPA: glycosyltransferase family 87 protein [Gammaproteobacteria bacterium]|nr:glycosyltransferase family 87 protein [Gammaproteobacteria bacterium]